METVQEACESLRKKTPEEILGQLTEAAASYSRGRAQHDDRTAAVLRYMPI
jgi:serine phosphatase RsbU (regulator of sigma subunit)